MDLLQGVRRRGVVSARDALVFVVIALVALVLIEGIIISNASVPTGTSTQVSTVTLLGTDGGGTTTTTTVVSNHTETMTSTAPGSNSTATITTTFSGDPSTVTSTVVSNGTTSTTTWTVTSISTTTNTSTVTRTTDGQSFVVILPGTSSSNGATKGYDPDRIVVVIGVNNTVTWINSDLSNHTVTSTSAAVPFDSGAIPPGGTFTFTFLEPGNYTYVCADFPWMSGAVTVLPHR